MRAVIILLTERATTDQEVLGSTPSRRAKIKVFMNFKWFTHVPLQKAVIYFFILIVIFVLILAFIF